MRSTMPVSPPRVTLDPERGYRVRCAGCDAILRAPTVARMAEAVRAHTCWLKGGD